MIKIIETENNFCEVNVEFISKTEIARRTALLTLEKSSKNEHLVILNCLKKLIQDLKTNTEFRIAIFSCFSHESELRKALEHLKFEKIFELDLWPEDSHFSERSFFHIDLEKVVYE